MDQNPYESPREAKPLESDDSYEPMPRASRWQDAVPGLAVIVVFMLSPLVSAMLLGFGLFHWPATLIVISLIAYAAWAVAIKVTAQ
jgi:hypothetical protein